MAPTIASRVAFDNSQTAWGYEYTVHNGPEAEQAIEALGLRFNTPKDNEMFDPPPGWFEVRVEVPAAIPGGDFVADVPGLATTIRQPSPAQISPGDSLAGFAVVSPYPPGYARAYVEGYAPVRHISEAEIVTPMIVPHDTTNSQRRWTVGPIRYEDVLPW